MPACKLCNNDRLRKALKGSRVPVCSTHVIFTSMLISLPLVKKKKKDNKSDILLYPSIRLSKEAE